MGIKNEAWTRPWDQKNIADIDATIVMDHMILAALMSVLEPVTLAHLKNIRLMNS